MIATEKDLEVSPAAKVLAYMNLMARAKAMIVDSPQEQRLAWGVEVSWTLNAH